MDAVASHPELFQVLPQQAAFVSSVFCPLLAPHESDIKAIQSRSFKYGPSDRHQLDIYFPPADDSAPAKAPILFFVYGGGYHVGSRSFDPPSHLVYPNVGSYFARQGFITVIADYRLYPRINFPDPAVDIRDAFKFVVEHISEINAGVQGAQADADNVFFLAHSAGASIVATMELLPDLLPSDLRKRIRGLILQGGAYHYRSVTDPGPPTMAYYGTLEALRKHEPLSLLETASDDVISSVPPVLMMVSEHELQAISDANVDFLATLRSRLGFEVPMSIMKGHNHISPHWCLWSGEGEEWATDVVRWIRATLPQSV